jgi:VanZ family protein
MNKQITKYIVSVGIVIAITVFIFSNSFKGYDASRYASDAVSNIILPHEYATSETASLLVRKFAHLFEYAALGMAVMQFAKYVEKDYRKKLYALACFYVLFVAVLDEHIQSFSDRTSSTGDILLDFFGAIIGFAIVITIHFIFVKLKNIKERRSLVEMVLEIEQKEKYKE